MKRKNRIPPDAVLLIPDPEIESEKPLFGIPPGYYDKSQMLQLLETHRRNSAAVYYIADMLETGDPDNDGFVRMLRSASGDPQEVERIVRLCRE